MRLITLVLTLFWSLSVLAQDSLDVSFLMTQRTKGNPFALPVRISSDGEVKFFGGNGTEALNFRPTMQLGFSRAIINYSHPVILNRFNFYPQQKELGWIEVKRLQIEAGAGLSAIIKQALTVGLLPYKGALHTIIRYKKSREDKSLPFKMPTQLSELEEWNVNDHGTFQTYGGVTAYAGISAGIIDLALGSVGIQNQFVVEMKKTAENEISLTITEENLKRRQIIVGPSVADATFANFKGKRLSSEFRLDLDNPLHHQLFEEALNGKLTRLQESLDHTRQNLSWKGHDRSYYVGIPVIAGKTIDAGHYDLEEDGEETKLDFTGSRLRGILTPLRNLQDFVYQKDNAMLVVWSSEMNKTSKAAFFQRFLRIGRAIGIKGFNREVPDTKFGSVVSQVAVHISKKEFESVTDIDMEQVQEHMKAKCEAEQLPCRSERRLKNIIAKLNELRTKTWKEMRGELGLLLIKEPAIIHAVVKTMKYKKEVYFKFLSEKYQSLEGSSAIEL